MSAAIVSLLHTCKFDAAPPVLHCCADSTSREHAHTCGPSANSRYLLTNSGTRKVVCNLHVMSDHQQAAYQIRCCVHEFQPNITLLA